jgi:hypothetical protein
MVAQEYGIVGEYSAAMDFIEVNAITASVVCFWRGTIRVMAEERVHPHDLTSFAKVPSWPLIEIGESS